MLEYVWEYVTSTAEMSDTTNAWDTVLSLDKWVLKILNNKPDCWSMLVSLRKLDITTWINIHILQLNIIFCSWLCQSLKIKYHVQVEEANMKTGSEKLFFKYKLLVSTSI